MYEPSTDHADERRLTKYADDYPEEYKLCFNNLNKVLMLLNTGRSLQSIGGKFLKSEGKGLYATSQSRKRGALEVRLYFAFNEYTETYFILGMGDKKSQKRDIKSYQKVISSEKLIEKEECEDDQTGEEGRTEDD